MINRICDICNNYTNDTWVVVISDHGKDKFEISGCKQHIDELYLKVNSIKGLEKMSVQRVLNEIGFNAN